MIKMTDYAKRRKALMQTVGAEGAVIIPSASEILRNGDAHFQFRQHSDFYYLTGFNEPDAVLVLLPKRKEGEYVLFNRVRDPQREAWDGPRAGQKGACTEFLADQSFPIEELEERLPELLAGREVVHYSLGLDKSFDKIFIKALNDVRGKIRSGIQYPTVFEDIVPTIHEMRLTKETCEVACTQKAVDITANAFMRAMQVCKPGMYEYELEAEFMHEFFKNGARSTAYTSIVASGSNACVLHYIQNNRKMHNGELVLIDAGAEYQNYAADITRTFPVNGKFTPEQKAVYEVVLAAQIAAIKAVKPGAPFSITQQTVVKVLTEGLVDIGLLKGKVDDLIEKEAYLPFYFHRAGHWLGIDVHDVGRYKLDGKWRKLQAGNILTVEPGIYISSSVPGVHKRWHGIGVRIEDDVLVTAKGHDVLSKKIPKTVKDIEDIMSVN